MGLRGLQNPQPKEADMSKLIAMVATAVILNGERTVIQPGQELPELPAHDERELLQSGAAENPADTAALAKADARAKAAADAEFEAARQAVQQAQESTKAETETESSATAPGGKPAKASAKPAARK